MDADSLLSDDSDFYGDADVRRDLEAIHPGSRKRSAGLPFREPFAKKQKQARSSASTNDRGTVFEKGQDVLSFLRSRPQLQKLREAHAPTSKSPSHETALKVIVDGEEAPDPSETDNAAPRLSVWRQKSESIDEFLNRLPVSSPSTAALGPWLWISCPNRQQPQATRPNIMELVERGMQRLQSHEQRSSRSGGATIGTTRLSSAGRQRPPKEQLVDDILSLAVDTSITCGKWMLFPGPEDLSRYWDLVARATADGRLGPTAKAGTYQGKPYTLICVYTYDFTDTDDVARVLHQLVDLGLCSVHTKPIYFKCDAYTYLGIESKNSYGLRASLFSSHDLLRGQTDAVRFGPVARMTPHRKMLNGMVI